MKFRVWILYILKYTQLFRRLKFESNREILKALTKIHPFLKQFKALKTFHISLLHMVIYLNGPPDLADLCLEPCKETLYRPLLFGYLCLSLAHMQYVYLALPVLGFHRHLSYLCLSLSLTYILSIVSCWSYLFMPLKLKRVRHCGYTI